MADNTSDRITVKTVPLNPASWRHGASDLPQPLQQHPSYGLALQAMGATANQLELYYNDTPVADALVIYRKLFGVIRFTTLFRGPVWRSSDLPNDVKVAAYKALRALYSPWRWNFLVQMPEAPADGDLAIALMSAGLKKVMTGFSTAWIDLRPDEETLRKTLKGKWRNQLVGAEKADFDISVGGKKPHQYTWLLEKEADQRDKRRYQATPLGLVPAFVAAETPKSGTGVLCITAIKAKQKIAGALFLLHGNSATYHIGWAGDEARSLNAQNRVLWQGMLALKERDIRFLDLGGLNTADLAGIARFKLGTGAEPLTLAGSFL